MIKRTDALMILRLYSKGIYQRDIAERMGCSERTVRRIIRRGGPAPGRRPRARGSRKLAGFEPLIDECLKDDIWNCEVIFQRLRAAGYTGGRSILRDYVQPKRALRGKRGTVRFETEPGGQLQHDWGELDVAIAGETRRVYFAVNTLGYSRAMHGFAGERQDAEHTYESLIRAFEWFGGVPAEVLVDNQRSAVFSHSGGEAVFNPRFADLAERYGFAPRACRPYRAQTKGKTERMVRYLKEHFFQRYQGFESIDHLNRCLEQWLREVADERIHGTHGERVRERFERDERPVLKPLPWARFDTAYRFHRIVGWDGFIDVEGNRYSVPDAFCGERVVCRLSLKGVLTVYGRGDPDNPNEPIAEHVLTDPSAGWQQLPDHHQRLWADTLVAVRDLGVYEELV